MDRQPVLVGRGAEREDVLGALSAALGGRPRLLVVSGEAGIGKTRLVEELCELVPAVGPGGPLVRIGGSAPLVGVSLAYGPFVAAFGDRAQWLLDGDDVGDSRAARHRLFQRVLGLVGELAAPSGLVLVLEDLHWADESSRQLLAFLAVRLVDQPVLMVATVRGEDLDAAGRRWLAEVERRPGVSRLHLGPLGDSDMALLVAGLARDMAAEQVAMVVRAAEGNPFYARELSHGLPSWPSASLKEAVLARWSAASRPVREMLDQISAADGGMSHELLAATMAMGEDRLSATADQAVAQRLLVSDGHGYAFPHELSRQIVYDQLLPGARLRLHRRLAAALAATGTADAAALARHWHLGGRPEQAAACAVVAARVAIAARAYPEAGRLYGLAVELLGWLPEHDRIDTLARAAQAASWAADWTGSVEYASAAVGLAKTETSETQARLLERLGRYHWEAGDLAASVAATSAAVALLEDAVPSALQARTLAASATGRMLLGDRQAALPLALRATKVAEAVDAPDAKAHGLATLGILHAQAGELDAGLARLRESFALAERSADLEDVLRAAGNHMYLLCTAGRFAEALQVAGDGRRVARSLGAPPQATAVLDNNMAAVLVATGRWAEADELLSELLVESNANVTRYLQLLELELAVGRGRPGRSAELASALAEAPDDPRLIGPLRACLAERALGGNDPISAAREVLSGLAVLADSELAQEELRLLAAGARAAADLAGRARRDGLDAAWERSAATFVDRAGLIAEQQGGTQPDVKAFAVQVAAEDARRQGTDSRASWRAVADAWDRAGQPHREAYARLREAGAAAMAGRREQASRALALGVGIARELGAAPLLAMAEALAGRARLKTDRTPASARTPASDRADLTDREVQVLALVANGDSNRQIARALFISERTAAVHVSHILEKLNVQNRTEAAMAATDLGLVPSVEPTIHES